VWHTKMKINSYGRIVWIHTCTHTLKCICAHPLAGFVCVCVCVCVCVLCDCVCVCVCVYRYIHPGLSCVHRCCLRSSLLVWWCTRSLTRT
jgi:hypothetical protein